MSAAYRPDVLDPTSPVTSKPKFPAAGALKREAVVCDSCLRTHGSMSKNHGTHLTESLARLNPNSLHDVAESPLDHCISSARARFVFNVEPPAIGRPTRRSLSNMDPDKLYTLEAVREAIGRGDAEFVRKAIDAGVDPNAQDSTGCTPLIFAAEFQRPEIVRLLLTLGADASHKESNGYDASEVAAWHGEWRMGAYTEASTEIRAILKAHLQPPSSRLVSRALAWLKRVRLPRAKN